MPTSDSETRAGAHDPVAIRRIDATSPIRLGTVLAWIAGMVAFVVVSGLGLRAVGDSGRADPGAVDIELTARRAAIDRLAELGDCSGLQDRYDDLADDPGVPGTVRHGRNVLIKRYAGDALVRLDCPPVVRYEFDNGGPLAGTNRIARH